jgi:putative aldouronate transport system permease protein
LNIRLLGDKAFDSFNYFFITLFALACLFPFFYVASFSITPYSEYLQNPLKLIPGHPEFSAYKQILHMSTMWTGYKNTILITVIGVALNIFLLLVSAYPLSKTDLKGRNLILVLITFTMFFNGGLIPNFYLIKSLHLYNTLWSMILPTALGAYNLILMKNFISAIPPSLEESAFIDGANEITVLYRIVIPLSKPAIATFVIFQAVTQWNTFFSAIIYTSKRELWPLMLILRDLVVDDGGLAVDSLDSTGAGVSIFTIKMAIIIFATLPILLIYPFLQKYFMKGILVGSIKG